MSTDLELAGLKALKTAAKEEFRSVPGIEGFGIGDHVLRVFVNNAEVSKRLPRRFHGVDLEFIITGDITAGRW